jgi:disulfide bond formation protein DsbB
MTYTGAMRSMMASDRGAPGVLLAASVAALLGAWAGQYVFGLQPCILCLYQRIPFMVAGLAAATSLLFSTNSPLRAILLGVCALSFATGVALASFHVGVEQGWWAGTEACGGRPAGPASLAALRAGEATEALRACNEVDWTFAGLSLAAWNVAYSGMLLVGTVIMILRSRNDRMA